MYLTINKPQHRFSMCAPNFDRWVDEIFNGGSLVESEMGWVPRADVHETDETYQIQLDLPGLTKDDVKVKFEDNTLIVSGERKQESKSDDKNYHRFERIYGSFTRSIRLPKNVNLNKVNANFKNGVLEIKLPKVEEVKPKEIEINIG